MRLLWIILCGLAALLAITGAGRLLLRHRSEPDLRGLPLTPLQKLAWLGVGVSMTVGAGLGVVIAIDGATALEDSASRGVFWLLLVVGLGIWLTAWDRTTRRNGGPVIDERDRAIVARSLSVESVVVLLSLLAWTVTLTEVFGQDRTMPIAYLQLIFWSTFLAGVFGRSLGIILGYRRETGPHA